VKTRQIRKLISMAIESRDYRSLPSLQVYEIRNVSPRKHPWEFANSDLFTGMRINFGGASRERSWMTRKERR